MENKKNILSCLLQPQVHKFQRLVEAETIKLEQEKRKAVLIDEQISLIQEELKQVKQTEKALFSKEILIKSGMVLQRQIQKQKRKWNSIQSQNKSLREQINSLRRKILTLKRAQTEISNQIQTQKKKAQNTHMNQNLEVEKQREQKSKIVMIRSKSACAKGRIRAKIQQLSSVIKEQKNNRSQMINQINRKINAYSAQTSNFLMNNKVLNKTLQQWKQRLQVKRKEFDSYSKKVQNLKKGFQIILKSSGLQCITDVVEAISKMVDQISNMTQFFNNLSNQIDILELSNSTYEQHIKNYSDSRTRKKQTHEDFLSYYDQRIDLYMININSTLTHQQKIKKVLQNIFFPIQNILKLLKHDKQTQQVLQQKDILYSLSVSETLISQFKFTKALSQKKNPFLSKFPLNFMHPKTQQGPAVKFLNLLENDISQELTTKQPNTPLQLTTFRSRAKMFLETYTEPSCSSPHQTTIFDLNSPLSSNE